ncbi:MAG: response regulator [Chitinophagaceae bacterium]
MTTQYPLSAPNGGIKKIYNYVLELGVHDNAPVYEMHRVRFSNFIGLFCQSFYLMYVVLSFVLHSPFLTVVTLLMLITGIFGFWLNAKRRYNLARTVFITSFSILLFFICNSLNIGYYFVFFYFPAFIAYTLYYDLEKDLPNALTNLSISVVCAICAFVLPHQYFMAENIDEKWFSLISTLNYFMSFAITIIFVFFAVFHINKSGRQLVEVWQEAERQKLELSDAKQKADSAVIAKSRFLSNTSHEMRTPLNGIIGMVNLLLKEPSLPEQQQNLQILKYSSEHMLNVINDVLDFSKIEAGKMELHNDEFNMKTILDKIYIVFKNQFDTKGINLELDIDNRLDQFFRTDETKLRQVLTNLIGNSYKFTAKGFVKLSVRLVKSNNNNSTDIFFCIQDTGIGMSKLQQQMIFDAFNQAETSTTRKYGGTGLGLTICKKIVNKLGGDLQLESEQGKGSRFFFTISLPVCKNSKAPAKENNDHQLSTLKGARVLVAEDNNINMMITRKFLQRWDVTIDEAVNGEEAVQLFRKKEYDVLLIDLDMPVMDGYEALSEIRKVNKNIPAIAFTAAVLPQMKEYLAEKGFNDFLQKPFHPEHLHKIISSYYQSNITPV